MPLQGGDGREKAFAVETLGIQLLGRLVGGGDQHHALLEHDLKQPAENDCIADIADEQFVEAQHPDLCAQLHGQGLQGIGGAGQLEQADMQPAHEVVKVLAPRRYLQALVETVHQPGLAATHRPP
ncbi:hypothetical protein D3C71_1513990 [compost metagenome]